MISEAQFRKSRFQKKLVVFVCLHFVLFTYFICEFMNYRFYSVSLFFPPFYNFLFPLFLYFSLFFICFFSNLNCLFYFIWSVFNEQINSESCRTKCFFFRLLLLFSPLLQLTNIMSSLLAWTFSHVEEDIYSYLTSDFIRLKQFQTFFPETPKHPLKDFWKKISGNSVSFAYSLKLFFFLLLSVNGGFNSLL